MKRRFICVSALLIFIGLLVSLPQKSSQPVKEFDANNAYSQIKALVEEIGPRPAASEQEHRAGEYIRKKFADYGWQVKTQEFSRVLAVDKLNLKKFSLVNSRNIVAVLPGKLPETIVIGAHYDSADFNVPGANDNASGVGVLLELARVIGQKPQEYTYVLVGFGAEELGLLGSRYFVENYDLSKVKLMLNLDMIGDGNKVALDGGGKISTPPQLLADAYKEAKRHGLKPIVQRDFMLMARASKEGGTSDFSPFLDKWIPSLGLGQGDKAKAYYHQPSDTMDKVNVQTLKAYGDLVLALVKNAPNYQFTGAWQDGYLTIDTGVVLAFISPLMVKVGVIGAMVFTLLWLIIKRRANWVSIAWLVPGLLGIVFLALLLAYLPELLLKSLKGVAEPWHALPGVYVLLRGSCFALIIVVLAGLRSWVPKKALPPEPDVYLAASIILLLLGTVLLTLNRWDVAFYLALWLILIPLCRYRYGLGAVLTAPVLLYNFHWQLLNSHLWNDFYRTCTGNFLLASLIYAVILLPLVLSFLGWLNSRHNLMVIRVHPRLVVYGLASTLIVFMLLPVYTASSPQEVTVRQEWKAHRLELQVSSKDRLPGELREFLKAPKGEKQASLPLQGSSEPVDYKITATDTKLKEERLVTVNVSGSYVSDPYLIKIKLRSDKPFTLVNGGDFFPLGKLNSKVRLTGEAYGGIYGLILERYAPVPQRFGLYLKAQGSVQLSIETQYQDQFVKQRFQVPGTLVKYENWAVFQKDI